jgi:hypothetical protein
VRAFVRSCIACTFIQNSELVPKKHASRKQARVSEIACVMQHVEFSQRRLFDAAEAFDEGTLRTPTTPARLDGDGGFRQTWHR